MPCHNCTCEFGILKKEVGCEICGFSFCKKCCSKKSFTLENSELKKLICNKCFENMASNRASNSGNISPPLAHKKRMAALKKQSFSVDSGSSYSHQWDNVKDKEISERLLKLKRDRQKDLPSETEIEERLAKLKGMDPAKYNAPPIMVYRPAEKRTSIDQAHDLMKQVKEEADLDSKIVKPEDEIAARLARLKGEEVPKKDEVEITDPVVSDMVEHPNKSEEMDIEAETVAFQKEHMAANTKAMEEIQNLKSENLKKMLTILQAKKDSEGDRASKEDAEDEEEANKLIEQLMAANIDEDEMSDLDSLNHVPKENEKKKEEDEEFPWCIICTEDAKMRCFGCDNDLYCINCFKESHDSLDIKDHKTCPYFAPNDPLA